MHDITKCTDAKCPSRKLCRRWTTKGSDKWQSHADFNRKDGDERCEDGFWPNEIAALD